MINWKKIVMQIAVTGLLTVLAAPVPAANEGDPTSSPILNNLIDSISEFWTVLDRHDLDTRALADNRRVLEEIYTVIARELGQGVRIFHRSELDEQVKTIEFDSGPDIIYHQLSADVVYIRVAKLTGNAISVIAGIFTTIPEDRRTEIVWDFRYAQDFNISRLNEFEELVMGRKKIVSIVLINQETLGLFETMTKILRLHHRGVVIGEPTGGQPFKYHTTELSSGVFVAIPENKYALNNGEVVSGEPVEPMIHTNVVPAYEEILEMIKRPESIEHDSGVRKALDLVRAYHLFGAHRF